MRKRVDDGCEGVAEMDWVGVWDGGKEFMDNSFIIIIVVRLTCTCNYK